MKSLTNERPSALFFLLFLVLAVLGVACASGPRDLSLLESQGEPNPSSAEDEAGERRRLQEMQLVRYHDTSGANAGELFMPVGKLEEVLAAVGPCNPLTLCPNFTNSDGCYTTACTGRVGQCITRVLQSIANLRAQPIEVPEAYKFAPPGNSPDPTDLELEQNYVPIGGTFVIPAQSAATRAAVLRKAVREAKATLETMTSAGCGTNVNNNHGPNYVLPNPPSPNIHGALPWPTGTTAAGLFAQVFVDGVAILDEVTNDAVEAILAAGDAQRSSATTLEEGVARSVAGSELSRAEAAHLLLGGEPGLLGSTTKAFCASPELPGRAQRALGVLRRAAPDPADVRNAAINIDTFLNGTLPTGSIAARLSYLDGKTVSGTSAVESYTDLGKEDFVQARSYLAQEIAAFARSRASFTTFIPTHVGAVAPAGALFYRGTNREPGAIPAEYYAALARYQTGWSFSAFPVNRDAGYATAFFYSGAKTIRDTLLPTLSQQAKLQFGGAFDAFLAQEPRVGELRVETNASSQVRLRVHGLGTAAKMRVVDGLDGLLCATTGRVEGAPCSVSNLDALTLGYLDNTSGSTFRGFPVGGAFMDWSSSFPVSTSPRFLVARQNDAQTTPGPGEFYLLSGFVLANKIASSEYNHPIIPALERKAGELLRPSTSWCSHPAVECDGTMFDERLSLENELSDDGDGVESSWKYYLDLAEQASAEAHLLGEQYFDTGIEIDRLTEAAQLRGVEDHNRYRSRVEGEAELIQKICGTAMSTEELATHIGVDMAYLRSGNGRSCTISTERIDCCDNNAVCPYSCTSSLCTARTCSKDSECCEPGANGACGPYECIAQRCVKTPTGFLSDINVVDPPPDSESMSRLRACVDADNIQDYAVLGTEPVCVWEKAFASHLVCHDSSAAYPCPVAAKRDSGGTYSCPGVLNPPGTTTPHPVTTTLNLFDSTALSPSVDPCHALRRLRNWTIEQGTPDDRARLCEVLGDSRIVYPGLFGGQETARASRLSGGFEYVATYGGRVTIKFDGTPLWSTVPGTTPAWPCAPHPLASASFPNALLSDHVDCGATSEDGLRQIARMNQRLLAALTVLKGLTYGDFENISVPAFMTGYAFHLQEGGSWGSGPHMRIEQQFHNGFDSSLFPSGNVVLHNDAVSPTSPAPEFWRYLTYYSKVWVPEVLVPKSLQSPHPHVLYQTKFPPLERHTNPDFMRTVLRSEKFCPTNLPAFEEALLSRPLPAGDHADWLANPTFYPTMPPADVETRINGGSLPDFPYLNFQVNYTKDSVADAAELLCESSRGSFRRHDASALCEEFEPWELLTVSDFDRVRTLAHCRLTAFERTVSTMVLPRLPKQVLESIATFKVEGTFPAMGGDLGDAILKLSAALTQYGDISRDMSDLAAQLNEAVDEIATALEQVQIRTAQDELAEANASLNSDQAKLRIDLIDFQAQSSWIQQGLSCFGAMAAGVAFAEVTGGLSMVSGAQSCASGAVTAGLDANALGYERRIAKIESLIAENNETIAELGIDYNQLTAAQQLRNARATVRSLVGQMAALVSHAQSSLDADVRTRLIEVENLRFEVLRAIGRAVTKQSTQAAVTENIDAALNAKLNVSKARYRRAHENAVRLTFLAKRAIENRLGIHLSELRSDLALVDAPASWESEICASEGIDYQTLKDPDATEAEKDFSEAFIGDYVSKLRNVVESYRLEYDFHEGQDEVVASLRDDVLNVRVPCEVFGGNLLKHSSEIAAGRAATRKGESNTLTPVAEGWSLLGCPEAPGGGVDNSSCLAIARNGDTPIRATASSPRAPGFDLTRGASAISTTSLVQELRLTPGRYRLSWYSKVVIGEPHVDANLLESPSGVAIAPVSAGSPAINRWTIPAPSVPANTPVPWPRHYRVFDLSNEQDILVALTPGIDSPTLRSIAAVMLEKLAATESEDDPKFLPPPTFVPTKRSVMAVKKVCEDTDGVAFRETAWKRGCTTLCPDGFSGNCSDSAATERCYWQTSFSLDLRDLEAGNIFQQAGFARGNFNYRIETIGLNFVGSEVRDCASSEVPSSCYAAGFVPYSLTHSGPFAVRNHMGTDFETNLFSGNIEHARGLGIERYLTNPLGSTDRELLAPYLRSELVGRPLDGNFLLRVWDDSTVDFENITDVQLYLKYRYWTRNN